MFNQGQLGTRRDVAMIAEMAESTFKHRIDGRRSAEDYSRRGINFAVEIRYIRAALEIVQKRDPNATVGKD